MARPTVKGELRLIGLDDSTTEEEARSVLAGIGGCNRDEVKTGPIRMMRNGLGTIWAQCPLKAALQISSQGKVRIGWTIARAELLRARPLQCFKCWGYGHARNSCQSEIDRGNTCYRCVIEVHNARKCTEKQSCTVCAEKGLDNQHRMGSLVCASANSKARQTQADRRTKTQENNGPKDHIS